MTKPTVGEAFAELLERIPDDRPELLAKLTDEMWLIERFPGETFPDGPPQETVDRMRAARERRYGPEPQPAAVGAGLLGVCLIRFT